MTPRFARLLAAAAASCVIAFGQGQLRLALRSEPRTLNPQAVEDDSSHLIRYLTGEALVRVNRLTQVPEPALATSWKLSKDGRQLTLELRKGVRFSDGSPFDSADVVHTFRSLMSPDLHSATADAFRVGDLPLVARAVGPNQVVLTFAGPCPSAARLMDEVAILSSKASAGKYVMAGPFTIAGQKSGSHLILQRNPNYWKRDAAGRQLPYLDSLYISIQPNRELQALAFRRGELDMLTHLDARTFDELAKSHPAELLDLGAAFDSEFLWFNQIRSAPIAEQKKDWFRSTAFRTAVSAAINRTDLARIAYRGHAMPAIGPYPPANKIFFNSSLKQRAVDIPQARKLLESAGFRSANGILQDPKGNPVAFSILTNAGNRPREQEAALIQRDLKAIGIQVNIVTLDFPALIERIARSYQYEACLLGLVNVDPDPSGLMNVFLSSGANHQWNPKQPKPETAWEAEIDRLMRAQAAATTERQRKTAFDQVQEILYHEEPFIYLVHPTGLAAVSRDVKNIRPTAANPQVLWNAEFLQLGSKRPRS